MRMRFAMNSVAKPKDQSVVCMVLDNAIMYNWKKKNNPLITEGHYKQTVSDSRDIKCLST